MKNLAAIINKVHCADCLEFMRDMPDGCVDLVITDPPYGLDKTLWDGNANWKLLMNHFSLEIERIIAGEGTLILFCATRFLKDTLNFISIPYRWQFIWYATNNMIHGDIGFAKYTSALVFSNAQSVHRNIKDLMEHPVGTSELKFNNHPTPKPLRIVSYLLSAYSIPTDIILDPFLGSGTTAVAAKQLGRNFIGVEINPEYCKIAEERLKQEVLPFNQLKADTQSPGDLFEAQK